MFERYKIHLDQILSDIDAAGLYKHERIIVSPQGAAIRVSDGKEVLNFCANNYLGLSSHSELKKAAAEAWILMAMACRLFALSVVRRICISNWRGRLLNISGRMMPFYMLLVLMPMVAFSNLCSPMRMRLFQMNSIMRLS